MRITFILTICFLVLSLNGAAKNVVKDSLECGSGVYVSPDFLIQGKVSGVRVSSVDGNIAGAVSTYVRGMNSAFGTSNPLWIVDGVPLSNCNYQIQDAFDKDFYGLYNYTSNVSQLDYLNLYDIESIQVIKNLSELAMYGSRGANGVIIINTKTGTSDDTIVSLNTNFGLANENGFCNSYNISVGYNRNRTSFRASAFFRDIEGGYIGAGSDRFGGFRINMDMKANSIFWVGFDGCISIGKQNLQSSAANYGVPTMGLALQGIEIPGKINTVDGWANGHDDYSDILRSNGNIYLQVNFSPSLHWRTNVSFDANSSGRYFWYDIDTEFGKQQNRAAAINSATLLGYSANTNFDYGRYFGEGHKIDLNVGGGIYGESNRFNNMSGDHFLTSALREKGFSLRESASKPHYISLNYYTWSANASVSYSISNFAGLDVQLLADQINQYDNNVAFYPSANVWIDLHEAFLRACDGLSSLKISGGWGKAGSRRFIPFQLAGVSVSQSKIEDALSSANIELNSTEPEKILYNFFRCYNNALSSEWNLGLETAFIKDRIKIQLGYYSKTTDEYFKIYGFGQQKFESSPVWKVCDPWGLLEESESFYNRGVEADIFANIVSKHNFRWDVCLNLAATRSDMKFSINENIPEFNPVPKIHGGLGTTLSFSGVMLDMNFNGATGFDIYNMGKMLSEGETLCSSKYVERGDWIRLSKIGIGYDFPVKKIKWIRNLRLTLTSTNLLTLTEYSRPNPDVNSFGADNNYLSGIDYGALPLLKEIVAGLKIDF